jgi:hypothetical protein
MSELDNFRLELINSEALLFDLLSERCDGSLKLLVEDLATCSSRKKLTDGV